MTNSLNVSDILTNLETIIHRDEGNRGINAITLLGELQLAASDIVNASSMAIITGFPCMLDYNPPTETDGPLGALSIARACLAIGKRVVILTDECNEDVLLSCAAASDLLHKYQYPTDDEEEIVDTRTTAPLTLESFSPIFDEQEQNRLNSIMEWVDIVIAIERPGPSKSGKYFTMRKSTNKRP